MFRVKLHSNTRYIPYVPINPSSGPFFRAVLETFAPAFRLFLSLTGNAMCLRGPIRMLTHLIIYKRTNAISVNHNETDDIL